MAAWIVIMAGGGGTRPPARPPRPPPPTSLPPLPRRRTPRAPARRALALAATGEVVTIGLRPRHPETGYGYIQCGEPVGDEVRRVVRFVEKPDRKTAEAYVASGDYLWNAGMFFFPARRILDEIGRLMPDLARILDGIAADPARTGELYPRAPKVSIDYGVMEKLGGQMAVVPADLGWSDVGSLAALAEVVPRDADGHTGLGPAI